MKHCFIVAMDQHVVEDVVVAVADGGVIGLRRIFDEHARFEARALVLADPGQFEFRVLGH